MNLCPLLALTLSLQELHLANGRRASIPRGFPLDRLAVLHLDMTTSTVGSVANFEVVNAYVGAITLYLR